MDFRSLDPESNTRRHWTGHSRSRRLVVESQHPAAGWLVRGSLRHDGVQDMAGAGLAGRLVWQIYSYDHVDLGAVTGDLVEAERALLDMTKELED